MKDWKDAIVIGAGPAGLSVAACLKERGIEVEILDGSGLPGGAYREIYPQMMLASPSRYNSLPHFPLEIEDEYTQVGQYISYLEDYARHFDLAISRARVEKVKKREGAFEILIEEKAQPLQSKTLVAATGMFDFPHFPSVEGLFRAREEGNLTIIHSRDWQGAQDFAGQRVLVVGGATSGVEIAEELVRSGLEVTMSAREKKVKVWPQKILGRDIHDWVRIFDFLPRWMAGTFCKELPTLPGTDLGFTDFRKEGKIEVVDTLVSLEANCAQFASGEKRDFDALIFATGFHFSMDYLPGDVERAPAGHVLADQGESRSWPGLYLMGVPCARSLASEFLRGMAADAPVVAKSIEKKLGQLKSSIKSS